MPEGFKVDLDGEQVLFDGTWYAKEDLALRIKAMVDSGDYRVSRPSAALEALQSALLGLRSLTVRLPVEQAEILAAQAARQGLPVGAFARELLLRSLSLSSAPVLAPVPAPPQASAFQSGPVAAVHEALTAAEAVDAIPLTPKRREETDAENDWFKRR